MLTSALKQPPSDDAEIRTLIDRWSRALEARDIDALMENYAPDVLLFDIKPPFQIKGIEAYRALWEECLPYFPAKFKSENRDLHISIAEDVAFCHGLHHITPIDDKHHPAGQTWLRVTVCYRKIGGKWLVTHEHVSIPFDPVSGKVSYITNAELAAAEI